MPGEGRVRATVARATVRGPGSPYAVCLKKSVLAGGVKKPVIDRWNGPLWAYPQEHHGLGYDVLSRLLP